MKKIYSILSLSIIFALIIATSCKKDDDKSDTVNDPAPPPSIQEPEKDIVASVEHLGVCYGPYHSDGQNPGDNVPKAQIEADLTMIAKNFDFFRTYTVADGMNEVPAIAKAKGLEVALGVWCYPGDDASTHRDIDTAVNLAKRFPNTVIAIVIGNETNTVGSPDYVAPATVAGYMDYAHSKMTAAQLTMPLTACLTGAGANQSSGDYAEVVLQKCKDLNQAHHQVVFLNIYPYFGGGQPNDISGNMQWSYNNGISNAEKNFGLTVLIGEIGWPSSTNDNANDTTARENIVNMGINFSTTLKWVDGNNFLKQAYNSFWFEMFDEPWKTGEPNGVGPFWGIYPKNGATKPKFTIPPLQ